MKRTILGLVPLTLVASLAVACGDDEPATTSMDTGDTTGDGDGDTGDGDGDGDTGDGDGDGDTDPGDGDGDTGGPDSDMDGVADGSDNCPDVANPNQLDYDDNGTGNVCDTQVFTNVTGTLNTSAIADAGIGNCNIPLMIMVTDGEVRVQLDDDAAVAAFEITSLSVADILDEVCDLGLATANVSMTNFLISNSGGPFPVSMAHSMAMHDGGQVAGMSDMAHPVLSTATLSASVNGGAATPSDLMLDGALPVFTANIMGGGASGTMSFADPMFVLAEDVFMVTDPVMINIDFSLVGLVGTLTLAP